MGDLIDNVRRTLEQLDAVAALDIFIIAAIIFALLSILRGTTAMTLLRGGVAFICLLFLLGRILELSVVNFLIRNSLPGLVLGVVVVFQPEIRRALERAGRTSIRTLVAGDPDNGAIDQIATAVQELSRLRHGAIIVFERGTGLEDYMETGIRIEAEVTPRIVEEMFYPSSPFHDKAMLVRAGKIVALCCTLPLAEGSGVARLGTRHRAALGISERTDAVALVVSEETGAISVASDGRLIRIRDDMRVGSTLAALVYRMNGARPRALAS